MLAPQEAFDGQAGRPSGLTSQHEARFARRGVLILRACVLFGAIAAILYPECPGNCANLVRVETLSYVTPGATGVRIGVYFTNDVQILGLVLPLELRTCSGGAYIAGPSFKRQLTTTGRIYNSPLGVADPNGNWPAASTVNRTLAVVSLVPIANDCLRPSDSTGYWNTSAALPDFVSPDAVFLATISTGDPNIGELIALPPGADPAGNPSYEIIVNANSKVGAFVVDTTCVAPANDLAYVADDFIPYIVKPLFQMGAVGVGTDAASCVVAACDCPCHADPVNCGGPPLGILDVVSTIDVAFRGVPATHSPKCPFEDTDLDCGGVTDIVDVVRVIDVELRGVPRADRICDPCKIGR